MSKTGRWGGRAAPLMLALAVLGGALVGPLAVPAAVSQETVPPATAPLPLSQRLRAQGHNVDAAEATYLDSDEQVTEGYVRMLANVEVLATVPPETPGWRTTMQELLRHMAELDPAAAPVPPPAALQTVHGHSVAYRQHLRGAAQAWLAGVSASDPQWMLRGSQEYGAAEQARLAWHQALRQRYTGQRAPGA